MFRERGILLDLYEDEKIVTVIRRHWFAFMNTFLIVAALLLVFFIGSVLLYGGMKDVSANSVFLQAPSVTDHLAIGAYLVFGPIYLLGVLGFLYISWLDYYLDVFVLTNKRILRLEQIVLFGQKVSETSYQHVQDVSSQVKGLVYTLLDIGTVYVETAGENENFSFILIKNPGNVAAQILEQQKKLWEDDGLKNFDDDGNLLPITEQKTSEKTEAQIAPVTNDKSSEKAEKARPSEQPIQSADPEPPKATGFDWEKDGDVKVENAVSKNDLEGFKQELKEEIKNIVCDIPVAPVIERRKIDIIRNEIYKDGRQVTADGVIWQSEQELTSDVLDVLNEMES